MNETSADASTHPHDSWLTLALAAVLLVALAMRLWGIGAQSLWHDEVLTTLSATAPFSGVLESVERNENKPPLYFIVMNLWVRAAGLSEAALRLPSALFGVAAVAVIYLIGRDLFGDRVVGLIAALLLAFSRYHIAYSQEARTYSLLFLLLLLAGWFAVRMIRRKALSDQIGYVFAAALAMYAHPFAAFALLALNLFYVACYVLGPKPATDLRRWLVLQLAFSLLFWPWLAKTWLVVKTGLPWIVQSTSFPMAMLSYAGSGALAAILVVLIGVALAYGLIKREREILLPVLLMILPVLGPLAFSSRLYQTFIPRYGIVVVGALLLFAAYGLARLRPWATVLICAAYVAVSLPGYGNYPGAEVKADIRGAARHILANAKPTDAVWNPSEPLFARPIDHYLGKSGLTLLAQGEAPDPVRFPRLWVIYGVGPEDPPVPAGYGSYRIAPFAGLVLFEFAARPEPATAPDVTEDSPQPVNSATVPPPR
ncbi:MAG TPA: glycosyltransferase family 39 protein [Tepidisphaeraceae bacterium]|nr:glycosyltransferase family 39 protein [Tepidisphaeraceae bacterium]